LLIRRIRELLYERGFTISGARNQLSQGNEPDAASSVSAKTVSPDTASLRNEIRDIISLLTL
jgi:DNA-binding transcriptional MerR regulator